MQYFSSDLYDKIDTDNRAFREHIDFFAQYFYDKADTDKRAFGERIGVVSAIWGSNSEDPVIEWSVHLFKKQVVKKHICEKFKKKWFEVYVPEDIRNPSTVAAMSINYALIASGPTKEETIMKARMMGFSDLKFYRVTHLATILYPGFTIDEKDQIP